MTWYPECQTGEEGLGWGNLMNGISNLRQMNQFVSEYRINQINQIDWINRIDWINCIDWINGINRIYRILSDISIFNRFLAPLGALAGLEF